MGVITRALSRSRNANRIEHLDRSVQCLRLGDRRVCGDRLRDLISDAMHGMEAGERILEDHRHVLASHAADFGRTA